MNTRAQCSLLFYDKVLFNEFIAPMKANKELNTIIIKCLSAYYYNSKVRELIDGCEDEAEQIEQAKSKQQELINNMRQNLMVQDFIAQELENTLQDGIDDITDIVDNVNNRAEETGFATKHTTDTGETILRIGKLTQENKEEQQNKATTDTQPSATQQNRNNDFMFTMLEYMLSKNGDEQGIEMLHNFLSSMQGTPINNITTPQSTADVQSGAKVTEETVTVDVQPNTEVDKTEEVEVTEVVEDSTDLLSELLQGII